jgi:hypothetical protein
MRAALDGSLAFFKLGSRNSERGTPEATFTATVFAVA